MIKMLKGVSGYRKDRSSFRFSAGSVIIDQTDIEHDMVRSGLAVYWKEETIRAKAEPPEVFAEVPEIKKSKVIKTVVKRGKRRV